MSRTLIVSVGLHGADGSPYNPKNLRHLHTLISRFRDAVRSEGADCHFDGTGSGVDELGTSEPARTLVFSVPATAARNVNNLHLRRLRAAVCGGKPFGQRCIAVTRGETSFPGA